MQVMQTVQAADHSISQRKNCGRLTARLSGKLAELLCGKLVINDDRHPVSGEFHSASTLELRSSIIVVCHKRMDQWALQVESRLIMCNDLAAVKLFTIRHAVYSFVLVETARAQPLYG